MVYGRLAHVGKDVMSMAWLRFRRSSDRIYWEETRIGFYLCIITVYQEGVQYSININEEEVG